MFERIRQYLRSLRSDEAEGVCRHLRRPANLSRRSFLRVLGVTSVTVAVGGLDKLLPRSRPCSFDLGNQAAVDAINDFTRIKMREDSFYRRILPPLQISNDELDRCVPTRHVLLPHPLQYVIDKLTTSESEFEEAQMVQPYVVEMDTDRIMALTLPLDESRARKFVDDMPACTCGRHAIGQFRSEIWH